jgi:hypothetical protein
MSTDGAIILLAVILIYAAAGAFVYIAFFTRR